MDLQRDAVLLLAIQNCKFCARLWPDLESIFGWSYVDPKAERYRSFRYRPRPDFLAEDNSVGKGENQDGAPDVGDHLSRSFNLFGRAEAALRADVPWAKNRKTPKSNDIVRPSCPSKSYLQNWG